MSKFMVLNTKGGVGKSTTAVQIIAPYLYFINGQNIKVDLVEFDDENNDSQTFINSKILEAKQVKITGSDLDLELINNILEKENLIIDIGGNKTTTFILNSLKNTNMIDALDCIVIPLTDGEQDSINAIKVYKKIRELSKEIKVVFALGRVDSNIDLEIQFLDFFGDIKGRLNNKIGYIEDINIDDRNIIKINNSESIKVARTYGITVLELSKQNAEEIKEKMKQFLKEKDTENSKKMAYRLTQINKAIQFKEDVLKESFKILNGVLA